jgi:UDP-glucose 4-epimerase
VSDLADAHLLALEALIASPADSFTLNCGYGRGTSVLEMLDVLDQVNGTPVARVMGERRAGDPPQLVASNSRLVERLGWKPRFADTATIIRAHSSGSGACRADRRNPPVAFSPARGSGPSPLP